MTPANSESREAILRQCAQAGPRPWYPKEFALQTGIDRDSLDGPLEDLRLGGLVQLTDWQEGMGQGYRLTAKGVAFLDNEAGLARLRQGKPVERPRPEPRPTSRENTRTWDRGEAVRDVLIGDRNPRATKLLVALNVLVFAAGIYLAQARNVGVNQFMSGGFLKGPPPPGVDVILHDTGLATGADLLAGQWWRLLTALFVHIGLMHLVMNMFALFMLGRVVERMWGWWRFLAIYLVGGVCGNCLALAIRPGGLAGASGSVCAVFAAFVTWVLLNRGYFPEQLAAAWLRSSMINVMLLIFISLLPNVSWEAHLGGAVGGCLVAMLLHYQQFGVGLRRLLAALAVLALPVGCVVGLMTLHERNPAFAKVTQPNEGKHFEEEVMPAIKELETSAIAAYEAHAMQLLDQHWSRRDATAVETALKELAAGRGQLEEAVRILKSAGPYRSPKIEQARKVRWVYIDERLKHFELAERCLREGKEWSDKDEGTFVEQGKRVHEAWLRWRALLH